MNREMPRGLLCVLAAITTGCAGDAPLIFGASNTIGISITASAPEQGGEFILGYKGRDLALVPVTMVDADGNERQIGFEQPGGNSDSYSVLGQFEANAGRSGSGPRASLGKFFATGAAARTLGDGFAHKLGEGRTQVPGCAPPKPVVVDEAPYLKRLGAIQDQQEMLQRQQKQLQADLSQQQRPQAASAHRADADRQGQVMLFGQYEALGFTLGGSAAQTGLDLTLGLKDHNIAIVPVIRRDANRRPEQIRATAGGTFLDGLSVLGQFDFEGGQTTGATEAGLGKFFATGAAARRLSEGFKVRLCEQYEAPQPKAAPAGG